MQNTPELLTTDRILSNLAKESNWSVDVNNWKFVTSSSYEIIWKHLDRVSQEKEILLLSPLNEGNDIYTMFNYVSWNLIKSLTKFKQLATWLDLSQVKLLLKANSLDSKEWVSDDILNWISQDNLELLDDVFSKNLTLVLVPNPVNNNVDLYCVPQSVQTSTADNLKKALS